MALFGPDRPGWRCLFFRRPRDLFDGYLVASPLKKLGRRHRWIFETGVPNIVHRTAALLREKFFQFVVKGVRLAGALDHNDDGLWELVDFPADIFDLLCAQR